MVIRQAGNSSRPIAAAGIIYFGNNATDNYNSLQARMHKNFNRGYSFMEHYTWSKGLDHDSNYFAVDPRVSI